MNPDPASILDAWRAATPSLPLIWNDCSDLALIEALLNGQEPSAALSDFARSVADAGGQLVECCTHLAALQTVLLRSAGFSLDWSLVPTVAEWFTCEPERWGFDPLTGCVSGSFLSVALHEYYRRALIGSGPGAWSLIVVKLHRSLDLTSAVMAEYSAGHVLVGAIPEAEIVAHVRPGVFAILSTTALIPQYLRRVDEAMTMAAVASDITVQPLPPKLRQGRALVASETTHSPSSD